MEKISKAFRFKVTPVEVEAIIVGVVVEVVIVWKMHCDTNIDAVECRWVIECNYWCDTDDRNDDNYDNDDIIITNYETIMFFSLSH